MLRPVAVLRLWSSQGMNTDVSFGEFEWVHASAGMAAVGVDGAGGRRGLCCPVGLKC